MGWETGMSWQVAQEKAKLLNKIRLFFEHRSIVEVETPLLSQGTVTDVHLEAFLCRYNFLMKGSKDYYLQTSPEFAMKRLLASGYGSIYQICKAFRHEEHGRQHNPEFSIIEWYRIDFDHHDLMREIEELLIELLSCTHVEKITYQAAFIQYVGIDPLTVTKSSCISLIKQNEIFDSWLADEDLDTLLQYIFSQLIEPKIGIVTPCFVYSFPSSQSSLAKLNDKDPRVANRFECYYQGIELLNGFEELTDADQQYQRFVKDNEQRLIRGLPTMPIDTNFISALQHGMPACAGVALGFDRLLMLITNAKHIDEVLAFNIHDS